MVRRSTTSASTIPPTSCADHRDRSGNADLQTVGLGAEHAAGLGQTELAQPRLQEVPRFQAARGIAALGLGLIGTQEDVPADVRHPDVFEATVEIVGFAHRVIMYDATVGGNAPCG